uniref:ATP synthase complex subunit 8 n=1 Tax=Procavia capensis TaxID=9813 RepID=Q7Y8K3_PROCA|nr:ATP synthase F0 subunit 8 [Procavia capensis]BAC78403.1 ATPase subunit 8 [Procavia capensis]
MPQLNTMPWPMIITTMIMTLFIVMQVKISKYSYPNSLTPKPINKTTQHAPWKTKWTKIYLPPLLPPQ